FLRVLITKGANRGQAECSPALTPGAYEYGFLCEARQGAHDMRRFCHVWYYKRAWLRVGERRLLIFKGGGFRFSHFGTCGEGQFDDAAAVRRTVRCDWLCRSNHHQVGKSSGMF